MDRDDRTPPVLTPTQARQGRRVGLITILAVSLALAVLAGVALYAYYAR